MQGGRRKRHQRRRYFTRSDRLKGARYEELAPLAIRQSAPLPFFLLSPLLSSFPPPLTIFTFYPHTIRDQMRSFLSFVRDFIDYNLTTTRQSFRFVSNEKKRNASTIGTRLLSSLAWHSAPWNSFYRQLWGVASFESMRRLKENGKGSEANTRREFLLFK